MTIRDEARKLIDTVEQSSGRKFAHRAAIEFLYERSRQHAREAVFDDLMFYAKFVHHASGVLRRFGPASEETVKLSVEFNEKLQKVSGLMMSLTKEAPEETGESIRTRYLENSRDALERLLSLLQELSWVKNYTLDQRRS